MDTDLWLMWIGVGCGLWLMYWSMHDDDWILNLNRVRSVKCCGMVRKKSKMRLRN